MKQNHAEWSYKTSEIKNPKIPSTFLLVVNGEFRDVVKASLHRIGTATLWISDSTNKVISPEKIRAVCLTPDIIRKQNEDRNRKLLASLPKTRKRTNMPDSECSQQARIMTERVRKTLQTREKQFDLAGQTR